MGRYNSTCLLQFNRIKWLIFKVGITGGIGSGKSSAAKLFAKKKIPTFSSDAISRELCEPDQLPYKEIVARFGKGILNKDETLNRSALGNIVFNAPSELAALENILHPAIFYTIHSRAENQTAPYCLLDIPLLVGTPEQDAVDRILVVDASAGIRIQRVKARSGWTEGKTRAVMDKQRPVEELIAAADDVVDNNRSLLELKSKIYQLHEKYIKLAKSRNIVQR